MCMYLDDDMYISECEHITSFLAYIPLFLKTWSVPQVFTILSFYFVRILDILTSKLFVSLKSRHEPMNY